MLSGALPFVGANSAELTLQHLNDEPDLTSLTGPERYVISRALSKDPSHRYATCREFVEALAHVDAGYEALHETRSATAAVASSHRPSESLTQVSSPTEFFEDDAASAHVDTLLLEQPQEASAIVELPPVHADGSSFRPSPALFLGIGGTAGRILRHLRQELQDKFGDVAIPALQTLLIDTDPKALAEVAGINGSGLALDESLNIPLRHPQHYRERWDQLLSWLSRRWLYNIPKSLRTEGLRPLGRLAFVDHARQTCQRIRRSMMQAVEPESIMASTATTGLEFRNDALRIYIVASISGGTGSGAVLDVAYAVRAMLKKLDITNVEVVGIMLHSTGRDPRHCELARVNAYSWLTEYHHFHQADASYPGDTSCSLPPHEAGVSAFDHTYFVHLGDSLDENEFDRATRSVADYLRLNAISPAQVLFDAARESSDQPDANLRSFGIHQRDAVPSELLTAAVELVSTGLLQQWQSHCAKPTPLSSESHNGTDGNEENDNADEQAKALFQELHLSPASLAAQARSLVEAQLGGDAATFLNLWLMQRLSPSQTNDQRRWEAIEDVFGGSPSATRADAKPTLLGLPVTDIVQPLAEKLAGDARTRLMELLDQPNDSAGVGSIVHTFFPRLDKALAELQNYRRQLSARLIELGQPTPQSAADSAQAASLPATEPDRLPQYFELRLDDLALRGAEYVVRRLLAELKSIRDDLTAYGRELTQLARATRQPNRKTNGRATTEVDSQKPRGPKGIESVRSHLDDLTAQVAARLRRDFLHAHGGLFHVVMQGGRPRAQLSTKIQDFARQAVEEFFNQNNQPSSAAAYHDGIQAATPAALAHGGACRALAILPHGSTVQANSDQLAAAAGLTVSTIESTDNSLTLCVEAEQLSLTRIAIALIDRRRDSAEFAKRVHCRADIAWTPLVTDSPEYMAANAVGVTTVSIASDLARQTEVL